MFLEAIESKLNKDKNRIREFQSILEKYAGQYKDNRSKIKRRDNIRAFKEEAESIRTRQKNIRKLSVKRESRRTKLPGYP